MKIEHLRYFITLANSASISKAAEELYISQQQLNRIITSLEEEVNAALVLRNNKGISLSKEGTDFMKYANNILNEYSAMKNHFYIMQHQINDNNIQPHSECKICLPPGLAFYSVEIVSNLKKYAPSIKLTIFEKTSEQNEKDFYDDALYFWFWTPEIEPTNELMLNEKKFTSTLITASIPYFIYNKKYNQFDQPPDNYEKMVTSTLSSIYSAISDKSKVNLVSSNVYQLLDSVVVNDTTCVLPDFVIPKVRTLYPDVAFTAINSLSHISVIYPSSYMLTETDEIVINYIKNFILNQQMLIKQML